MSNYSASHPHHILTINNKNMSIYIRYEASKSTGRRVIWVRLGRLYCGLISLKCTNRLNLLTTHSHESTPLLYARSSRKLLLIGYPLTNGVFPNHLYFLCAAFTALQKPLTTRSSPCLPLVKKNYADGQSRIGKREHALKTGS